MQSFRSLLSITVFTCALAAAVPSGPVSAQEMQPLRIVAVVNNAAISDRQLQQRIALTLALSEVPDTEENRRKAGPQVLRQLIDEMLKRQATEKQRISVEDAALERALGALVFPGKQHRPGEAGAVAEVDAFMQRHGLPVELLRDQVRSELAWAKMVAKRIQPRVSVSEEEVDSEIEELRNQARMDPKLNGQFPPRLRMYHITYPITENAAKPEIIRLVNDAAALRESVRGDCAAFLEAGQKINRLTPVDRGLVPLEELHPVIREKVASLREGEITKPFRTPEGMNLIMVCGREEALPPLDREMVRQGVFQEKLELEVLEYLRELRRDALVEIR